MAEQVELAGEGVVVRWPGGRRAVFPHRQLRLECRCAQCEDELTGERKLVVRSVPDDVVAVEWLAIGRYALQFLWSDGHQTGIYPYAMLLEMAERGGLFD